MYSASAPDTTTTTTNIPTRDKVIHNHVNEGPWEIGLALGLREDEAVAVGDSEILGERLIEEV